MDERIWKTIMASIEAQKGDDNPARVARNIVHALTRAGFEINEAKPFVDWACVG